MSLRQLVEGDCGAANPLMQLGGQFTRDVARKDEGFMQFESNSRQDDYMVNEFTGQVAGPPQSFHMEKLLQEMREIESQRVQPSRVEVAGSSNGNLWAKEFGQQLPMLPPPTILNVQPQKQQTTYVREFFDETGETTATLYYNPRFRAPAPYLAIGPPNYAQQAESGATAKFFAEHEEAQRTTQVDTMEDWINDYEAYQQEEAMSGENYNEQFWQRLQEKWQQLSEEAEHPWLAEYNENYDPYKKYDFTEDNPMAEIENAFEMGKEYLARGDIPSAVLCFEVAAKKDPENAEIWEILGLTQAENEMDPQSIAALKRSLEIKPDNPRVLMALAVCYTNESLQSQALKMLTNWMQVHPKYSHIMNSLKNEPQENSAAASVAAFASSLIRGNRLQDVQNMFLEAVRQNPNEIDSDIQEALGVLYNLSAEFDKAVDCFQAALHARPENARNAKLWNRLGASLANGSRSVEAVEAYQQALQLEPGFIRVRYNVGVCCMNLKAYKQAVEHLLTALNMQANSAALHELPAGATKGQQKMSESIWTTLRMIISLMGRNDLHGFVTERNLAALNEAFRD